MAVRVVITLSDLEIAIPLDRELEAVGINCALTSTAEEARAAIRRHHPALLVLTGGAQESWGAELGAWAREQECAVLVLLESTDPGRRGAALHATEVQLKPVAIDELAASSRRLLERRELQQHTGIFGDSAPIQELLIRIEQMAPVSSTVLIQGESGTGKELVAKAIHDLSPRRGRPFIAVNCAALPETLLESELFGHEKGAFTGAAERRLGRFELADTGTIFLDEIGEIPHSVQVKLLRVLETRSFFRLGGVAPIKVDVRVVAATNRSLSEQVASGAFREDLYYRLNVLSVYLPPLRERRGDIPALVRRFVREFTREHERPFPGISAAAMELLVNAAWPGNVRQLRNLVESMVVLAPESVIQAEDLPSELSKIGSSLLPVHLPQTGGANRQFAVGTAEFEFILHTLMDLRSQVEELRQQLEERPRGLEVIRVTDPVADPVEAIAAVEAVEAEPDPEPLPQVVFQPGMTMAEVERQTILAVLAMENGNRRKASQLLQIGERTLYRKLKEYGIEDGKS